MRFPKAAPPRLSSLHSPSTAEPLHTMNRNLQLTRPDHTADLKPLLVGLTITPAEKAKLADLRAQLAEVEAQLDKVSNPVVSAGIKSVRSAIRAGTGTPDDLQNAIALGQDCRDIRRTLKTRQAEIGRSVAQVLAPLIERAIPQVERGLEKLRQETKARLEKYLPHCDADALVEADPCVAGVRVALAALRTQAESLIEAQDPGSSWKPYTSTIDRMVAPLLSPA